MAYFARQLESKIKQALKRGKSVLLWGARQTGKTTLLEHLNGDFYLSLILPEIRQRYEKDPLIFRQEIEALQNKSKKLPLVFIDEIQKVPSLFDSIQYLIDKKQAQFILTGSSARNFRRQKEKNLLPGRVVSCHLDPLTLSEAPCDSLQERLLYGSLPGIVLTANPQDKEIDLESYVVTYLEEEIRMEAVVRKIGDFARFLELAASESGHIVNYHKLSKEIGVAHTTITSYYQILEDSLIAERIESISRSKIRKMLTKSPKYLFFDLGVRRLAAREGTRLPRETMGQLFEQFVGLELLRNCRLSKNRDRLFFWRDPTGPEVDWVLDQEGTWTPIEVKWTSTPSKRDIKYLELFLQEYKNTKLAYVICQAPRKMKLSDNVFALPWQEIERFWK